MGRPWRGSAKWRCREEKQKAESKKQKSWRRAFLLSAFCFLLCVAMRDGRDSFTILEKALGFAAAEADAVFASTDHNISRFANSSVHQNMSEISAWLKLRVVVNGAVGTAATTSFDDDELARTAELAREAATHSGALPGFP